MIKKTGNIHGADWHGKMTTALIYTTIGIHMIWYDISRNISLALMAASLLVMLLSLTLYILQNIRKLREQES